MQSAAQPAPAPNSYSLGVRIADFVIGGAAAFELTVAGVLLGGASSLTPWLLFAPPIFFAAGFSRGCRPGSSWRRTAIMTCASAIFLLRGGILTALLGATYVAILIGVGVGARRHSPPDKRRAKTFIACGNALPFFVLVGVIALWYSYLNQTNGSIVSSGMTRRYLLQVPKSYDPSKPAPLVISLHPAGSWAVAERAITGWNDLAEERGFLVVYPAGRSFPQIWPNTPATAEEDVKFISELIDKIAVQYDIDPRRIYMDGISNGGAMTFTVSCRLSNRIAAIGVVAAAQTLTWDWCGSAAPIPVMTFHGTADRFVPYLGGTSIVSNGVAFPDVREWVAHWSKRNHCTGDPLDDRISPNVRRIAYKNCAANADVVLYTVAGGGHTWPGGGFMPNWIVGKTTTQDINGTRLLWDFYTQHPRARK